MFNRVITLIASVSMFIPMGIAQFNAPQQQSLAPPVQPTPMQVQACLAVLPPAPKPPRPVVNLFPGFQQKIDDMIRKAGGDPVAMRKASADAALQKYADAKAAYERQRSACSMPSAVPLYPPVYPFVPLSPSTQPVIPASSTVPTQPIQTQQPK